MSLADCICEIAKNKGVMEFTMYDHDLKPMPKDHCFVCCVELYHSAVELSCFAQSASHEFVCRMMERPRLLQVHGATTPENQLFTNPNRSRRMTRLTGPRKLEHGGMESMRSCPATEFATILWEAGQSEVSR